MNRHIETAEKTRDLVDEITEGETELSQALARLSHVSRAVAAYVDDAQRHLLVAARNPQGITVTFDRWHRPQTPRPRR